MDKRMSLMRKGFDELQEMRISTQQNLPWRPPTGSKIKLSKAAKAVRQYYERQLGAEDATDDLFELGYAPEVEELQKTFLMRPGCPRYSHRATSTAHLGHFAKFAGLPSNISTISLTSQLSMEDWTSIIHNTDLLESKSCSRYSPAGSSKNISRLTKWKSSTEAAAPVFPKKSYSGSKIPWYVAVLQEKDMALQRMSEEFAHLTSCQTESTHKDEVISVLREEMEAMQHQLDRLQQQLDCLQRGNYVTPSETPEKKSPVQSAMVEVRSRRPIMKGSSLPAIWEQSSVPEEFLKEIQNLKLELAQRKKCLDLEARPDLVGQEQLEKEVSEEEYMDMQPKGRLETGEETLAGSDSKESKELVESEAWPDEETEEEMILRKLFEFQRINNELYEELGRMKYDYDIATGTICTLQRQLSFEGSQLRRAHGEQELLQKELRERGEQLDAMSNKFCNLRDERKYEEMMGNIERENCKLRQEVADLKSKLEDKSQLIDSMQGNVSRLQAEVVVNQHNTGKQLGQQNELQRQLEILQRAEQQTRVVLETISSRFDRFRTKIIQTTYGSPGFKSPQAEISDDEVLDALQKIISDRVEFHQLLKHKGVKVPPLGSETSIPTTLKKKSPTR